MAEVQVTLFCKLSLAYELGAHQAGVAGLPPAVCSPVAINIPGWRVAP